MGLQGLQLWLPFSHGCVVTGPPVSPKVALAVIAADPMVTLAMRATPMRFEGSRIVHVALRRKPKFVGQSYVQTVCGRWPQRFARAAGHSISCRTCHALRARGALSPRWQHARPEEWEGL